MIVLGIETSCDDTGIAIYETENNKLLSNVISSSQEIHSAYGGIIPEFASRDHVVKIKPLLQKSLIESKISVEQIDLIAYTCGPGLVGSLMVGAAFSKSLSFTLGIPSIEVNHLEGHILAILLNNHKPEYPYLALIISGGHTQLVQVSDFGKYSLLGQSLDDAIGEVFDKVGKILGLPYPGGPNLENISKKGQKTFIKFPRPMCDRPGLNFSFSGLKTSVFNFYSKNINKINKDIIRKSDIAFAFQQAAFDTIFFKCRNALEQTGIKNLVISGGVSSNLFLRKKINTCLDKKYKVYYPSLEYCTDNGAMIAVAGAHRFINSKKTQIKDYKINVNSKLSIFSP